MFFLIEGSVGEGTAVASMGLNDIFVPVSLAMISASFTIFRKKESIFSADKSLSSRLMLTLPGITLGAPGSAWIRPTVPT